MDNIIKSWGTPRAYKPEAGGATPRMVPLLATVKDNIDPIRIGRLQVYLADFGGTDPNDSTSWTTVSYMSPFYGLTPVSAPNTGYGDYLANPHSYGMWTSPPDIGTTVICIFINGDPNYGYYIGCAPEPEALHMVPAIGGSDNITVNAAEAKSYGGATRLPVVEMNTNNTQMANSSGFLASARPVHSYLAGILKQQGLIRDPIRGVIGSSAQRESPSRVGFGVSTPGRPIYEGGFTDQTISGALDGKTPKNLKVVSRRGGHSLVMDDGDVLGRDQLIRLRTSMGHQILMSDDGQCLFIIHSNGQSWIELGKEGTIDMYATNSVNVRTQGDLNFHADNNININAMKTLNVSADAINMSSDKKTTIKTGTDFNLYSKVNYTVKVDSVMSMASSGEASYASSDITYINGSKVNLNTGSVSLIPAIVPPIPIMVHTDTLYDDEKGFIPAPGKLLSIVSRAPAHTPWATAGQGVDVKVNLNASASFPTPPAASTAAANTAAGTAPNPVTAAAASTVTTDKSISAALDKNVTATMVGQVAAIAQTGPAAAAAALGAGVVDINGIKTAAIGAFAASPQQLEAALSIKPGSAALVNSLVQSGKTIEQALTPNLFTGQPGAENLAAFTKNSSAQTGAMITNLQQAQTAVTNAGLMTGSESPTQIAGIVLSGATAGVDATVKFVKNAAPKG